MAKLNIHIGKYIGGDKTIWIIVFLLSMLSLPLIFSTTNSLALQKNISNTAILIKQILFVGLGFIVIYFTHKLNYRRYSKISVFFFWFIAIPLLIATYLFGVSINGAHRWLAIPGTGLTLQTSEIAKTALVLYLCNYLQRNQATITNWKKGFLPVLLPIGIMTLLIAPSNLSSGIYVVLLSMVVLFIGGARLKHILKVCLIAFIPIIILISWVVIAHEQNLKPNIMPYGRMNVWIMRVDDFLYSSEDSEHYQVQQSKIALAKGGIFGVGPGNSEQRNFLPSAFSDYIFSVIIEEYGLIGGIIILLLYLVLVFRVILVFTKCQHAFGAFVCVGLGMDILLTTLLNVSVNSHIIPVTGLPLPFLSRGGTSLLISCLNVGIILSVSRWINKEKTESSETLPTDLQKNLA